MAIPAGLEPACRLIRNQVLIQLSYGTVTRCALCRERIACKWLPSQESNLPELCLTGSRVHLARLRGILVDRRGNAPRSDCLQGIPAPLCAARGAQSWLRSNLSAVSARRCHQISCLSNRWRCRARSARIGLRCGCARRTPFTKWSERRESNPRLSVGAARLCH